MDRPVAAVQQAAQPMGQHHGVFAGRGPAGHADGLPVEAAGLDLPQAGGPAQGAGGGRAQADDDQGAREAAGGRRLGGAGADQPRERAPAAAVVAAARGGRHADAALPGVAAAAGGAAREQPHPGGPQRAAAAAPLRAPVQRSQGHHGDLAAAAAQRVGGAVPLGRRPHLAQPHLQHHHQRAQRVPGAAAAAAPGRLPRQSLERQPAGRGGAQAVPVQHLHLLHQQAVRLQPHGRAGGVCEDQGAGQGVPGRRRRDHHRPQPHYHHQPGVLHAGAPIRDLPPQGAVPPGSGRARRRQQLVLHLAVAAPAAAGGVAVVGHLQRHDVRLLRRQGVPRVLRGVLPAGHPLRLDTRARPAAAPAAPAVLRERGRRGRARAGPAGRHATVGAAGVDPTAADGPAAPRGDAHQAAARAARGGVSAGALLQPAHLPAHAARDGGEAAAGVHQCGARRQGRCGEGQGGGGGQAGGGPVGRRRQDPGGDRRSHGGRAGGARRAGRAAGEAGRGGRLRGRARGHGGAAQQARPAGAGAGEPAHRDRQPLCAQARGAPAGRGAHAAAPLLQGPVRQHCGGARQPEEGAGRGVQGLLQQRAGVQARVGDAAAPRGVCARPGPRVGVLPHLAGQAGGAAQGVEGHAADGGGGLHAAHPQAGGREPQPAGPEHAGRGDARAVPVGRAQRRLRQGGQAGAHRRGRQHRPAPRQQLPPPEDVRQRRPRALLPGADAGHGALEQHRHERRARAAAAAHVQPAAGPAPREPPPAPQVPHARHRHHLAAGAAAGGGAELLLVRGGVRGQLRALRPRAGPAHHPLQGPVLRPQRPAAAGPQRGAPPQGLPSHRERGGERERAEPVHVQDAADVQPPVDLQEAVLLADEPQRGALPHAAARRPLAQQDPLRQKLGPRLPDGPLPRVRQPRAAGVQRAGALPADTQPADLLHALWRGWRLCGLHGLRLRRGHAAAEQPAPHPQHVLPGRHHERAAAALQPRRHGRHLQRPDVTGPEDGGGSQRRAVHQAAGHDGAAPKAQPQRPGRPAPRRGAAGEGGAQPAQPVPYGAHLAPLVLDTAAQRAPAPHPPSPCEGSAALPRDSAPTHS
mmetsp:Transcript_44016/g.111346  ORF Transcript_44016/g.111346 Transcript_44016/m.111346 type:complete len:1085 (-) Transcript_44016:45-3299(-)